MQRNITFLIFAVCMCNDAVNYRITAVLYINNTKVSTGDGDDSSNSR